MEVPKKYFHILNPNELDIKPCDYNLFLFNKKKLKYVGFFFQKNKITDQ